MIMLLCCVEDACSGAATLQPSVYNRVAQDVESSRYMAINAQVPYMIGNMVCSLHTSASAHRGHTNIECGDEKKESLRQVYKAYSSRAGDGACCFATSQCICHCCTALVAVSAAVPAAVVGVVVAVAAAGSNTGSRS